MAHTSRDEASLLRLFIEQAPVAMAMLDRQLRFIATSHRWLSEFGLDHRDLRGVAYQDVFPDLPKDWQERYQRVLQGELIAADGESRQRRDGRPQWIRWDLRPWYQKDVLGGLIVCAEDISRRRRSDASATPAPPDLNQLVGQRTAELERNISELQRRLQEAQRLRRQLQKQAIRDPLTGLFNRRILDEVLTQELEHAAAGTPAALIMLDIDRFKQLNDQFGHQAGDAVLRQTGQIMRRSLRRSDIACRYGGDEFMVILPQTDLPAATQTAEQLRQRLIELPKGISEWQLPRVGFSIGVAALPGNGGNGHGLLRSADQAMYRAKQAGGDRVMRADS